MTSSQGWAVVMAIIGSAAVGLWQGVAWLIAVGLLLLDDRDRRTAARRERDGL